MVIPPATKLAQIHNQTLLPNWRSGTCLDNNYLHNNANIHNMPMHKEINESLKKMGAIVQNITNEVPQPYVPLWNKPESVDNYIYGNPAWDLGAIVTIFNNDTQTEGYMREYLSNKGVRITIIELHIGILYAKLQAAISKRDIMAWRELAKNECTGVVNGMGFNVKEITGRTLARLALPGLARVNL